MIICPRCRKENDDKELTCISCGFPLNKNKMPKGLIILALMMSFMFIYYNTFYVKSHEIANPKGQMVTKLDFGEKWAFSVEKGYLYSIGRNAIFLVDEVEYGINKEAINAGYRDIRNSNIWKENDKAIGERIDIQPFVEIALKNQVK